MAQRPAAEPITAVIADHVRTLRIHRGMTQADLAIAMADHGVPWERATVVNLEKRSAQSRGAASTGRDAVTVQELLALASVFGVPPPALLGMDDDALERRAIASVLADVMAELEALRQEVAQ